MGLLLPNGWELQGFGLKGNDILTCGQDDIRLAPDDIQADGLNDIREPVLADVIRRAIDAPLCRRGGG